MSEGLKPENTEKKMMSNAMLAAATIASFFAAESPADVANAAHSGPEQKNITLVQKDAGTINKTYDAYHARLQAIFDKPGLSDAQKWAEYDAQCAERRQAYYDEANTPGITSEGRASLNLRRGEEVRAEVAVTLENRGKHPYGKITASPQGQMADDTLAELRAKGERAQ